MDVKYINPFFDAFLNVMPELGINDIKRGKISLRGKTIQSLGVLVIIGIVGDLKGNIIYETTIEDAKAIASKMMMGAPVKELDEMAQSAIEELTNMLTANASTSFSNEGIRIDISTPTLMYGNFKASSNADKTICVEMILDGLKFQVNVAIEKCK
jgi:chemotaxis protein CheX